MFFNKFPHPANFVFMSRYDETTSNATLGKHQIKFEIKSYENDIFHIRASSEKKWKPNLSLDPVTPDSELSKKQFQPTKEGDFELQPKSGRLKIQSSPGHGFGVSVGASMFQFEVPEDAMFFGMGEKFFGKLELSGIRTKFWNTDVWSDFHWAQWSEHPADPPYCSVPYLAMRTSNGWVGFLLDNPGVTFMETPGNDSTRVFVEWQRTSRNLILGSEDGEPNLWVFFADDLAQLTRKLQSLVGKTPLPPAWSLGFHQSRWGYGGHDDLLELDRKFEKHEIPCSALWLDLDYMVDYKIFTVSDKQFPKGVQATADILKKNGRRIVPIIDPGVKSQVGYDVFDDGVAQNVFCKNPEGQRYIGLVWPGETVFPDFMQTRVREWWADYVKNFRKLGFGAAWVDMNDPSTGPVDPSGMLFHEGRDSHELHRNQYALGMQKATVAGFQQATPNERPFLLSRSGFIGTSKYSAIWTGDNVSNDFYLKLSIPTTLGLSISGIPFNGPDLAGFGGDASDELMIRWFQACMLFPFYRNHSTLDSRKEEPWEYKAKTRKSLGKIIKTRYQFLPYLMELFRHQEQTGEAIVRPLIYDFDEPELSEISDEFMVGPMLLHAPILGSKAHNRQVTLPGKTMWLNLLSNEWHAPGTYKLKAKLNETLIFGRNNSIVPIQRTKPTEPKIEFSNPHFLIIAEPGSKAKFTAQYSADDGLTLDYTKGKISTIQVTINIENDIVQISTDLLANNYGKIEPTFALLGFEGEVYVNKSHRSTAKELINICGSEIETTVVS